MISKYTLNVTGAGSTQLRRLGMALGCATILAMAVTPAVAEDASTQLNTLKADPAFASVAPQVDALVNAKLAQGLSADEVAIFLFDISNLMSRFGLSLDAAVELKQREEAKKAEAVEEEKKSAATKNFLGFDWSLGVSVTRDFNSSPRVSSAKVVNGVVRVEEASRHTTRLLLETHYYFRFDRNFGNKSRDMRGWGPFIGIQSSEDDVVDAFAIGMMFGWRHDPSQSRSFNLGLGVVLDPKVQVLGDGIDPNQPLPNGETEIRYKKEDRWGALLIGSFSF